MTQEQKTLLPEWAIEIRDRNNNLDRRWLEGFNRYSTDIPRLLHALETEMRKVVRAKEALEFCASDQAEYLEFTVYSLKRTKGQYRAMQTLKELEE